MVATGEGDGEICPPKFQGLVIILIAVLVTK